MDVRKFINDFKITRPADDWEPLPVVLKEGREGNVYYYTEQTNTRYIIQTPQREILKQMNIDELKALLPKFGKFEIENFFENRFLNALLVTSDMTEIFSTTVLCSDYYWSCKFGKDRVKEVFMKNCFVIDHEEDNIVYLKLTGKHSSD